MPTDRNGDKHWQLRRTQILFYAGLLGAFSYITVVTLLNEPFHVEFLLLFGAMMGISIFQQGVDKK